MKATASTLEQLIAENCVLRQRLAKAESQSKAGSGLTADNKANDSLSDTGAHAGERDKSNQLATLSSLIASAPIGVVVFDTDMRYLVVNQLLAEMNGVPVSEHLGKTYEEVVPDLHNKTGSMFRSILASGKAVPDLIVEGETPKAPGVRRTWRVSCFPVFGERSQITGVGAIVQEITEQRRMEERLQAAEAIQKRADERLGRVFDTQTVGMIEWNFDTGLINSANSYFLKMVGYSAEDVVAGRLKFGAMTPPNWTARNETNIAAIRQFGRAQPYEKEYFRKDGTRVPVMIAGVSFEDSPHEGMSVVIDLTDVKRAEAELRFSESRFRAAVGLVSSIVWTNDAQGLMKGEQSSWSNFTGQDQQGYQGYGWLQCVHPDDVQPTLDAWKEAVQQMRMFECEHRVRRRDDKWRVCLVRAVPLFDPQGALVEWVGVHTDITKQRQGDTRIKASEVRFRRLFESAKDGILILDAQTATITDANPYITEMLGYSHQEFVGKELWQIGLFEDVQASKNAVRTLQSQHYIRYDDLPLKTQSGKLINVEFVSNVYREGGETVIQCNIREITERKRLEESLREQTVELAVAARRKDEFLATLAHELRNPLAPIRNGLQILRRASSDPAGVDQTLSMMERQLGQMVHLVDDLLDVSRISLDKLDLRLQRIELREIISNAVETSRPLVEAGGHEFTIVLPAEPVYLNADMTRLGQVFANLLNNAAKYTGPGGQIRLKAEVQGRQVYVSVTDSGVGIAPDMLSKIFEMFTQVDQSLEKAQGGLGIGLCLVKQLVELHGGSVHASSNGLGHGSDFVVVLPTVELGDLSATSSASLSVPLPALLPASPPMTLRKNLTVAPGQTKSQPGPCRILVADDNVDAAASLAQFLEILGHDVRTANDGLEAVDVAAHFRPDVILLDIAMPKLNGYDACRRIREQSSMAKPFIIALTGWGQEESRRLSLEAGFDHHLVKPMDPALLEQLLAKLQTQER